MDADFSPPWWEVVANLGSFPGVLRAELWDKRMEKEQFGSYPVASFV